METNNKRVLKNTFLLYFRMILTMAVSLYTVRIVLETLGAIDYGIFNVVAGVVLMFSFLSNTMSTASQRFFAFELGRQNYEELKKTFSMTMTIYILIAIIILLLAETIGLWFLNNKMSFPENRVEAANWVFQFAIFSFMMTMFTVPYNAAIIAHEKMSIYAYVSVVEVLLKLLTVFFLREFSFDKLKLYSILTFFVTALISLIYRVYCVRRFNECRYFFYWDSSLFKKLISYSSWNLFGAVSGIFNNYGVNIVLNLFFGPIVNTARGIAFQISSTINQFTLNFMTATRPQITKYYAAGMNEQMTKLVFQSSKLSFLLLFILSMPVLLETNFVLMLWLGDLPPYVVMFTKLVIINTLIDSVSISLQAAAQATGRIKLYQFVVGGVMLLNLPVCYLFLSLGCLPETVFYLSIGNSIICLVLRLSMLKNMIGLSVNKFFVKVLLPVILISIISCIPPYIIVKNMGSDAQRFVWVLCVGFVTSLFTVCYIALSKDERQMLYFKIFKR